MKQSKIAVIFFILYAIFGLICFDDYGCGPDEGMERQTSLVSYRYALDKLHIPISDTNRKWMAYLPELKEYRDRYYGTALHLPLVLIESAFHFTLEPIQFYGMRHFYTFLNYYLAMICFYRILLRRFDSLSALAGTAMMVLTPRFFAESFYNNKDILFTAWYIFSSYFSLRWIEKKSIGNAAIAGAVIALAVNTRLNAIVFLPMLAAVTIYDYAIRKEKSLSTLLILFGVFSLVYYAVTPNLWESPFRTFFETLNFNHHHPNHNSEGNLFFGKLVNASQTKSFIPVWILISTPLLNIVLSFIGCVQFLIYAIRNRFKTFIPRKNMEDLWFFCVGFLPVIGIIFMHVTIYNGWRHCYFCYPSIVYFAVFGFYSIRNINTTNRKIVQTLLSISQFANLIWIVRNHPYEYDYFSFPFRRYADSFSGDYWGISTRDLIEWIAENDPDRMLDINHLYTVSGSINRGLLPEEQRKFITMLYTDDADYYLVCRDDKRIGEPELKNVEKVYSIRVDQDEIGVVYRKKD